MIVDHIWNNMSKAHKTQNYQERPLSLDTADKGRRVWIGQGLGRKPVQQRSQARVDAILEVALTLLIDKGTEGLVMRDIARRAEVQIGSLYQYFPNKAAVLKGLGHRFIKRFEASLFAVWRRCIEEGRPLSEAVDQTVDAAFSFYLDEPGFPALWAGFQSDPALSQLDRDDTLHNARIFTATMVNRYPSLHRQQVLAIGVLLCEAAGSALRYAVYSVEPMRTDLIESLKQLILLQLETLINRQTLPQ